MKNIERIQNMSAEELAQQLDLGKCSECAFYDNCKGKRCEEGIVKWLNQEEKVPQEVKDAVKTLDKYCNTFESCSDCPFDDHEDGCNIDNFKKVLKNE